MKNLLMTLESKNETKKLSTSWHLKRENEWWNLEIKIQHHVYLIDKILVSCKSIYFRYTDFTLLPLIPLLCLQQVLQQWRSLNSRYTDALSRGAASTTDRFWTSSDKCHKGSKVHFSWGHRELASYGRAHCNCTRIVSRKLNMNVRNFWSEISKKKLK